jgi:hypothetical protein
MKSHTPRYSAARRLQRGVTTLVVALCLLVVLTIIILTSSNVALFEQKTTVNENRQMLAGQAAEYALNLGGEYLKANVVNIASNEDDDGWLFPGGTNLHWQTCEGITNEAHPCFAEPVAGRRNQLYYYTADGTVLTDPTDAKLDLPLDLEADANLASVGGDAEFPVTARVSALLCRLDTTVGSTPTCQAEPTTGNRVAITLVSQSTMAGESASAQVKETWGTFNNFSAQAAVPLVASGIVEGLGNATIVAAPNAGGYGLPASIWSPRDVDIEDGGGGVGSVNTCHLGDYLGDTPVADLQTTCAGNGNPCSCGVDGDSSDFLSGGASDKIEGLDVLDIDGGAGDNDYPDIEFFPGDKADGTCLDDATVDDDDNLFEWIFGEDVNSSSTCTADSDPAMQNQVLEDLGATIIDLAAGGTCASLNSDSSGLIQVVNGSCDLPNGDVGSPDNPVVLVIDDELHINNTNVFGMVFVRDSTGAGTGASIQGNGNAKIFGSVVVEGEVDMAGTIHIVYIDTSTGSPGKKLPATTRFARLPGSWLDSASGV